MSKLWFARSILALPLLCLPIQAQTVEAKSGSATVSGRVTLKGAPAAGVSVVLQPHVHNPDAVLRAKTDGAGRFHFASVVAGHYSIAAFAPGAISPSDMSFSGKPQPGKTINLSDGENVENIDLTIKPGGVITGRVIDPGGRPLVEELLTLFRLDKDGEWRQFSDPPNASEMFRTNDRGIYRIFGLPDGRYIISAGYEELSGWNSTISERIYYPRAFYPNAPDESNAKIIEVAEGFEAINIDITVGAAKKSYDLHGRVVNADNGEPVAGLQLTYGSVRDGRVTYWKSWGERSGANGEFRLIGLLAGKYGIVVASFGDNDFIGEQTTVELTDDDLYGVEIKVRKGATVSGVVAIEGANDPKTLSRLSQSMLMVSSRSGGGNFGPLTPIKINADGSFRVRGLPKGTLMISLMSSGLRLERIEHNGAPREAIEVNPGEHLTGLKLIVTRQEGN